MPLKTLGLIGPRAVGERVKECQKGKCCRVIMLEIKSSFVINAIRRDTAG
jgi:hypothetical protein